MSDSVIDGVPLDDSDARADQQPRGVVRADAQDA